MASQPLQTGIVPVRAVRQFDAAVRIEKWLEAERNQLALWAPVMLGCGIAAWFILPNPVAWSGFLAFASGVAIAGWVIGHHNRTGVALTSAGLLMILGCGLIWSKSIRVAAPVLERPVVESFAARVERSDLLAARDRIRLVVSPLDRSDLPPRFRVNIRLADAPDGLASGTEILMRARLMPPAGPALPGGYDFARRAWFDQLGATGTALGKVVLIKPAPAGGAMRARLSSHIQDQIPGSGGAIAAALATGDQGGIGEADAEAMRRSGLAHLLSISGLHVTAVVSFAMWLLLKLLALNPNWAMRWNLPLLSAAGGALAGIGYTVLTGAEVPTVRSCIAALLVLGGFALGREAITLRLVATGALVVLLFWPETVTGPSFQLSFAAVTAIVAFHQSGAAQRWFGKREEQAGARLLRGLASLFITGLVVEIALIPISLVHFYKAGLYGALANMVAIPLTTFVVMPLEALALLLDMAGLGMPAWWLTGQALSAILAIAHYVAEIPGAVVMLPGVPPLAFGMMVGGGFWLLLWQTKVRKWGVPFIVSGALWALTTPSPDLLISGDGRHIAARGEDGEVAILRERAGDYTRNMLAESAGIDGDLAPLKDMQGVRCNDDFCIWTMADGHRPERGWTILASRSTQYVEAGPLIEACRKVDIVISDRQLPRRCTPRWLRLDKRSLEDSGGLAIGLRYPPQIRQVRNMAQRHPWLYPQRIAPPRQWRNPAIAAPPRPK